MHDAALALVAAIPEPASVLEVGCANGWRLALLQERYGAACCGCDVSEAAIADGRERYPDVFLSLAAAHYMLYRDKAFDVVIFSFVLHWIDRPRLASVIAEADRVLAPGGHLIVVDFLPLWPTKRRYHHRQDVEAWTYKQDYAACWLSLGTYTQRRRILFNHDTGEPGVCDAGAQAAGVLLRKEEAYTCA
ncbi:MAG: class I SAM-dependent methyltransferase [Candidatus Gracilibacteria bacterium]|jgi:ubiquinone/menaquinone biosynthesis C-methylase UbiE